MLRTKMCNVRTCVTHEYDVFFRTYVTYENIICPNLSCLIYELILNTKMFNVRTLVTHENMMSCVRTYATYKLCNVRTLLHTNMRLFSVRTNGTYENV